MEKIGSEGALNVFSKYRNYLTLIVVIVIGVWAYLDMSNRQQLPVAKVAAVAPQVKLPDQPSLFQPAFLWADSKDTRQGTGFLVKASNGKVIGVTSAHFINFDGQLLKKAAWLDIQSKKPIARFSKSFGLPGDGGSTSVLKTDLRSDFLLLLADAEVPENLILQLDDRDLPAVGERVFLPNKDAKQANGFQIVAGQVKETHPEYIVVELDAPLKMQSQSGSPILSQVNGKVIGTLSRNLGKETTTLYLTPSSAIVDAMKKANQFPELEKVIGKPQK